MVFDQRLPVEGAVAGVGPAVLIEFFTRGGDVLDVDRGDAAAVFVHPRDGVFATLDQPGEVHLPFHVGRGLEKDVHRELAVGAFLELPVVVVVAEADPRPLEAVSDLGELGAEIGPACLAFAVVAGRRRRAIERRDPDQTGDPCGLGGVLELGEAHMRGRHRQPRVLDALGQRGGIGELAAPAFDLAVAKLFQRFEDVIERAGIAGAVELVGEVHGSLFEVIAALMRERRPC